MKFFNKMVELSEKAIDSLENKAKQVQKTYQEKGLTHLFNESVEQAQKNIDLLSKKVKTKVDEIKQDIQAYQEKSEEKTPDLKASKKKNNSKFLTNILSDGEIAMLNSTPLELVLENLQAKPSRIPGKWTLESGSTISLAHQKWFHFQTGTKSEGAIDFLKFILSNEKFVNAEDVSVDEFLKNDALLLLQKYQQEENYQQRVSTWIKSAQSFEEKKTSKKVSKTM